jgi:hypothetical protein
MTRSRSFRKYLVAAAVLSALLITDEWQFGSEPAPPSTFISSAEARIGRPLTPVSVAGVARRTTRRVIRRSTVYVAALPAGCVRTTVNGSALWLCGGVYYQAYGGRYVVVYVN